MEAVDVLVLGGGIAGLTAAIRLAEGGARVAVVDAGINAGSAANAGSLHVQMQSRFMRLYPDQVPGLLESLPLYVAGVAEWDRLEAAHGPFGMVRAGGLMLAESAGQMAFLEGKTRAEAARGLDVAMLDRAALDRLAPWLGPAIVGAELCRDEGKLDPLRANARLRAHAEGLGVAFRPDRIVDLEAGGGVRATGQGGRVHVAAQAVVAAGWGAGPLVAGLGLSVPSRAEPLHMNVTEPGALGLAHLVQHAERSITLKALGSGQVVIGGGWPARSRGDWAVPVVEPASLLGNVALAGRLVPALAALRVVRTWAGMNTVVDGRSTLGRVPGAPAVVMAVPGDAGYTLGPLVGRLAADVALGRDPGPGSGIDLAPFDPGRFSA